MDERDFEIADAHAAATRGPLVAALREERAAHAATREELRRAVCERNAAEDAAEWAGAHLMAALGLGNDPGGMRAAMTKAVAVLAPIRRRSRDRDEQAAEIDAAPASPSTEATVRAGIEEAAGAVGTVNGNNAALTAAHAAIRALDPAAIAARLAGS